jgi:tetratricopeptide (TPR) repeat protein
MITDSLSKLVRNYLEIKVLEQDAMFHVITHSETHSAEAYRYYIQGKKMQSSSEYSEAIKLYHKALARDSCFVSALLWLTVSYMNNGQDEQARLILKRTARYIDQAPLHEQLFYDYFKAYLDKDLQGRIKAALRLTEEYPYEIAPYFALGFSYNTIRQYEKASDAFDRRIELMKQRDFKEKWFPVYYQAGRCYHELGQHIKEQEVYELGLQVLPNHPEIIYRQAICALSQGDTTEANKLIEKYRSIREEQGLRIESLVSVSMIYEEADHLEKAENSFRHAFEIYPENAGVMNDLALFLIRHNININEGMEIITRALDLMPDNWNFLYSHGLGLYKQGKLTEAKDVLGRSWEIRQYYNHEHYLLIQEVDQALAGRN